MSGETPGGEGVRGAWRPRDTTPAEDAQAVVTAVGAAAAVGALTFWLVRTLLGRERIDLRPPERDGLAAGPADARRLESGPS